MYYKQFNKTGRLTETAVVGNYNFKFWCKRVIPPTRVSSGVRPWDIGLKHISPAIMAHFVLLL